ncbi:hypothetical protein [Methylovirgula ligni]|nr:hypothetical protein [Methylovirgula ligni]
MGKVLIMKRTRSFGVAINASPTPQIRQELVTHLYEIGETVTLDPRGGYLRNPGDPFSVLARLPPVGTEFQYRIKSVNEPYQRVAAEYQLKRAVQAAG